MNNNDLGVYLVATPIGNLKDISKRAIETIEGCDFIICENPKHSIKLLNNLGIKKKLISLHDYNEAKVVEKISHNLANKKIALISDAGSPLISDPGYKLIRFCISNNINVTSIPGPSSIIPALQLSGIPINSFSFYGFVPKTKKQMRDFVIELKKNNHTSIFFVSSHKLEICLEMLADELADRLISVSKELTKINERVYRGLGLHIKKILLDKPENLKGEFIVVVDGKKTEDLEGLNIENYNSEIIKLLSKFSLTDVVEIVHKLTGITKNKVYKWVLKQKKH